MQQINCRAILFDLDGVLVDSTACVERHWRIWAKRHELDAERILANSHGRRSADTIRAIAPWLDAEAEATRLEQTEALDTEGVVTAPGASELLTALRAMPWAVVTSGSHLMASTRLRFTGLPTPPVLITAEDVHQGKPAPEGYLQAASQLGIDPQHCVVIEDAPPGIEAGRAAQATVIGVATTYPPAALRKASICIPALTSLTATIATMPNLADHEALINLLIAETV
jgi:sugar-phosphatase